MASDTNNIGLYIGAPPASGGQSTKEVMSGIGTPVSPDGTVESQVGYNLRGATYWEPNEIQTGHSRDATHADGAGDVLPLDSSSSYIRPVALDTRYGEGIGFSIATEGDYMVVGAPYAWKKFSFVSPSQTVSLPVVAEQTHIEGMPPHTEDCFGVITITVTGDLQSLWADGVYDKFTFLGQEFTFAGDLTAPGASSPSSWSAFTWYLTSYDGGGAGEEGSATIKAYPCDSSEDCWIGTGGCTWSIGFTEDEAGTEVLYQETTISNSVVGYAANFYAQGGAVYTFKKPRGLITNATNASPIVVTTDGWGSLGDKRHSASSNKLDGARIKIEGVGGNTAANGDYFLKYISSTSASLYHDRELTNPVGGNGAFKFGGSWKGSGGDSWLQAGIIEAPFPGGWSEANIKSFDPGEDADIPLYSDARFGWSVDLKDKWVLIGEPRGKRVDNGFTDFGGWYLGGVDTNGNEPRLGSFSETSAIWEFGGPVSYGVDKLNQLSGDTSTSGRVYIYHFDRADESAGGAGYYSALGHPNPHLDYTGRGIRMIAPSPFNQVQYTAGYEGVVPNARIAPEHLYGTSEDSQITYNMGTPNGSASSEYVRGTDGHFGHSVAFSPKIEGAPFGPDNPVTILVGAPYARIDKNETGIVTEEAQSDEDIPSEGDEVPEPSGGGFGGDEQFTGDGSGDGETIGEGGLVPEPGTGDAGGTSGVETGGSGESTGGSSVTRTPPSRDVINRVGHTYAFIGAYPDSGNASYSVWRGLPNLYMGNETIGEVLYNQSDIKCSGAFTINNLIGVEKVSDNGEMVDVVPIEDSYLWQRLEHRIYNDNHPLHITDGRGAQDRFGWAVGIKGNTAIVGAPRHSLGVDIDHLGYRSYIKDAGAAYLFTRSSHSGYFDTIEPEGSGALFTKYVGVDENAVAISGANIRHHRDEYDNFGYSVAINENFFAVGAPRHAGAAMGRDFSKEEGGAVYIWEKQPGGNYVFDQKICHNDEKYGFYYGPHIGNTTDPTYVIGSGRDAYSHFGASLSLCGNNLLAGAPFAGGGLDYDYDASLYTTLNFREKLSTEYFKGGDGEGEVSGFESSWNENSLPDNNNLNILYRGGWAPGIPTGGTNYVGNGRAYLFQRQGNREDTRVNENINVAADLDDATINSSAESYDDSSDTIAAGGNLTSSLYSLLRFNNMGIPRGSQIHNAYIEMTAAADDDIATTITIYAFDEDDGEMPSGGEDDSPGESGDEYVNFTTKLNSKKTLNKVSWTLTRTMAGKKVQTAPIAGVIQEIVDRPGWSDNNSIVIILGPKESKDPSNGKKIFYSANYGFRYSDGNETGLDARPRINIDFTEPRDQWKQTNEFIAPIGRDGRTSDVEDYGRSVGLSKEDIIIGGPEYALDGLGSLGDNYNLFTTFGGSGSVSHRDFVGLGCRGYGDPGTPGGNFPHVFSMHTKGVYLLASGMDAHAKGHALDSGNITLTIPKAHAKFSHAMPLYVGPLRARGHTSLYTRGAVLSSGSMPLVMTFRATGNLDMFLKNFQYTGGMPLTVQAPLAASGTADLFTVGPLPSSGDITLHNKGHLCFNSPVGTYPEGYPSLFVSGDATQVTATGSLYTTGPIAATGGINITGPYNLPASGQTSLYTRGLSSDNTTLNLTLEKITGDIDDGIKLYTAGPASIVPPAQSDPDGTDLNPDDRSITLFTKYDPSYASSATSSHSIVKLTKQQTITGDSYREGGIWGSRVMDFLGDSDSDEYSEEAKAHKQHYLKKQNDTIDIHGKSMAVGSPGVKYEFNPIGFNDPPHENGSVKIYSWDGDTDTWSLAQTIQHPNNATEVAPNHSEFGASVAVDDTNGLLVIGEPASDTNDTGKAHIYRRSSGTWAYEATVDGATVLTDGSSPSVNDKKLGDRFGHYVAIDSSVVIVGAPGQDYGTDTTIKDSRINSGAVYVFEYDSGSSRWERTQKLVNPDRNIDYECLNENEYEQSYFGLICKIKDNTIVVGAPSQSLRVKNGDTSIGYVEGGGAVYIFDKSGTWSFTKAFYSRGQSSTNNGTVDSSITYTSADYNANFGASLDFYGHNIVVGAPKKQVSSKDRAGEAYILEKSGGTWSLKYTIIPTETFSDSSVVHSADDLFGYHVSILNEDTVLIGSPKHDYGVAPSTTADTAGTNTGAIYVFGIKGGNQIKKFVREEVVSNQFFGYNNVAFEQGNDAQLVSLTYGKNTSESANVIELYRYLSSMPLNIRGPLESNSNTTLFTDGVVGSSGLAPLFTEGMTPANEDTTLMLLGPSGINATGTLHTKGWSPYQTVFNLTMKASMTGPEQNTGTYSTLSLVTKGPIGASSAGWPYWNLKDHRYARKFNITVQSGFYTNDTNAFHIDDNYPPYYYNANPPEYEWGDPILERGRSYVFDLSDSSNSGHTFYISKINDGGGPDSNYAEEYLNGVSGSRSTQGGQLEFHVPDDAPEYLYVHCGLHSGMGWRIQVINKRASTPDGMSLYIDPAPLSSSDTMGLLVEGSIDQAWGTRSNTSMGLFAKVRDVYPESSGINLYTRSVGTTEVETSSYMNLWVQSTGIEGGANFADYMNLFLKPQTKVDVTSNMNLSLLTPAHPTEDITLYLHNTQTKKEANIFTPATGGMNLFLGTTSGTPFGVLPSSSMNLVMPIKGLSGGQQFASRSFDGTFPDAGLDLYIGNTDTSGSMPLFTRSVYYATGVIPLSIPASVGVHSGVSTFMIRGYNDSASGI